ncbi:MAG: flavin reductase family protein [Geminicoccaceae bacterium]
MNADFDQKNFRRALGQYPTGVTVITTVEPNGTPRGFTANSFTSVSLDPPLLSVCIAKSAASCETFCTAPHFAINILEEGQKDISGLFATQRPDKFQVTRWQKGKAGTPLIEDGLARFECLRHDQVEAGDHVILIGRVTDFAYRGGQPLGYVRGSYFTLGVEASLVDALAKGKGAVIGAIYECDGALLLEQEETTGALRPPAISRDNSPASLAGLAEHMADASGSLTASIDFVYAVFEDQRSGGVAIYYRGRVSGNPPRGMLYVPRDDVPWGRVVDDPCRSMLKRYTDEATQGGFAIYMGDETAGLVRPID